MLFCCLQYDQEYNMIRYMIIQYDSTIKCEIILAHNPAHNPLKKRSCSDELTDPTHQKRE